MSEIYMPTLPAKERAEERSRFLRAFTKPDNELDMVQLIEALGDQVAKGYFRLVETQEEGLVLCLTRKGAWREYTRVSMGG